jgi:8-oxo-dGTP pyrophosphatase MutT (NUDIX family)
MTAKVLPQRLREVEEETGWRPRRMEYVSSCQPIIGNADYPQDLYLAHGAEQVGEPEVDETAEVRWVHLEETPAMIARGDILGAITIIGVQHACCGGQAFSYLRREVPDW